MEAKELRQKTLAELDEILMDAVREDFVLRMQHAAGGLLTKTHLLRGKRRDIARIKTIMNEKRAAVSVLEEVQ